ncbi:hypothetical protein, partial [Aromatoleum evansii]|uniref:hypothetical protein n=1 Tax=Aromatoleum evansii TaxID=59406 RepID=UPI001B7CFD52
GGVRLTHHDTKIDLELAARDHGRERGHENSRHGPARSRHNGQGRLGQYAGQHENIAPLNECVNGKGPGRRDA